MPDQTHTLPTVIGSTENALRALLVGVLSETAIAGYEDWVALNVVDRAAASGHDIATALGKALGIDADRAHALVESTVARGLLARTASGPAVSPAGTAALAAARPRVALVTRRLVEGLPAAEVEVAARVLDQVRVRAEHELGLDR